MTSMLALCAMGLQLIVLGHVSAIPWEGPRATGVDDLGVGWTPLPTGTPGGSLDLVKRAGQYPITVCGFIGGDLSRGLLGSTLYIKNVTDEAYSRHTGDLLERIILCMVLRLQRNWVLYDFGQCLHGADHLYR